ncbi:MAG: hypothetical protein DRI56_07280 [Chloroflexota bacterium]|nr:MAG: hypothetical protein DRI56_07280 [Chloroflexota bacterium]
MSRYVPQRKIYLALFHKYYTRAKKDINMPSEETSLADRVEELRAELTQTDTRQIATQTGATYKSNGDGTANLHLTIWGKEAFVSDQDYIAKDLKTNAPLDFLTQAFLAYYFHDPKGSPPEDGWISFTELPSGQFYNSAFQGYTSKELLRHFESDYQNFREAAQKIGGVPVPFAAAAYKIQVFPRVAVLVACWEGDEEFPPSYRILFNSGIAHHLPTEVCAILGEVVTKRLLKD